MKPGADQTHFGYQQVDSKEKPALVDQVFTSVADNYDIMNDLMSMGIHRLWKRHFVRTCGARAGHAVLDLAGGTGDITALMTSRVGSSGFVVLTDINAAMLAHGRDRLLDDGLHQRTDVAQADAQILPFQSNSFDRITMAFGLRNVTDQPAALAEMVRVLKPGGRVCILEFSQVEAQALKRVYDLYSFSVLPRLGALIAGDQDSYQYLAESIRRHPDQETLRTLMGDAGFAQPRYRNLTGGIVAIHSGTKP